MFCINCAKLALLHTIIVCIRCSGSVFNNLSVLCEICSEKEKVCSICLKKIISAKEKNKSRYKGCGRCGK